MYVSLYVYVSEWEKKRKSKWEPLRSVFQVPRLKEKYSSLDLIGRVLCSSGSFKLCVWFCARMKKYSNCHFYYKSKVIKMVRFYGEWVQCVLFLYGFYVSSWPKAPLISCYTAVSLGRAEQKNHRINVHCIWHSCPFAGKGEAGLRSLLCVMKSSEWGLFATTIPQTSSSREEPFLPGRLFPGRTQKALEELAVKMSQV